MISAQDVERQVRKSAERRLAQIVTVGDTLVSQAQELEWTEFRNGGVTAWAVSRFGTKSSLEYAEITWVDRGLHNHDLLIDLFYREGNGPLSDDLRLAEEYLNIVCFDGLNLVDRDVFGERLPNRPAPIQAAEIGDKFWIGELPFDFRESPRLHRLMDELIVAPPVE